MNIYIGEPVEVSDMQGPCPDGFHIPLSSEWEAMKTADYYISSGWFPQADFHIPQADYIQSNGTRNTQNYGYYWMSDWNTTYSRPNNFSMRDQMISTQYSSMGCSIRPFKNAFVEPESSWTVIRGTFGGNGIFWNQTDEIISIVYNDTKITIADKNLGATEVYINQATKTQANCGKYYQWGNNHGFDRATPTKTDSSQVNASSYGPGNYYESDTFRSISSNNWDSSNNANLRGGVSQGSSTKTLQTEVRNIYIGEYTPPTPTDFEYTGAEQCATLPRGTYCLEVWGAQGGSCARVGGFGGYSSGKINITQNTVAYIQVGGAGTTGTGVDGGYNGGGRACSTNNRSMTSGGGGTDIRLGTNDLYHRVIVAGGGGGGAETNYGCGTGLNGAGGGLNGINNCGSSDRRYGYGGTQTSGGAARTETNWDGSYINTCLVGKFGQGGGADGISTAYINGGGGGWYGGGAGGPDGGAGGGSGYIWSATSCSCHPNQSCMSGICYMTDGILCAGNTTFPSPDGGTETGHTGNGYARITPIN